MQLSRVDGHQASTSELHEIKDYYKVSSTGSSIRTRFQP
jgi:hypothetical protein